MEVFAMLCNGIVVALAGPVLIGTGPAAPAEAGVLPAYYRIWRALGKDELKGVPEARKELVASLRAAAKGEPAGLPERERALRARVLASSLKAAGKLDAGDLKKAREGFGALSGELRKLVEAFPGEWDAYVVYCDMARKSWLQDTPKVLNPYYGSSMAGCGSILRRPGKGSGKGVEGPRP